MPVISEDQRETHRRSEHRLRFRLVDLRDVLYPTQPMAVLPFERLIAARENVFVGAVEGSAHRLVVALGVGPECGENVVGTAAEQQVVVAREERAERLLDAGVPNLEQPAAFLEAAGGILGRPSGRLHDPVQAHEHCRNHFSHDRCSPNR